MREYVNASKLKPRAGYWSHTFTQLLIYAFTAAAVVACSIFLLPMLAAACPGCKEALFDPGQLPQKLATAKGYALSIGVLLTVPFALVGGVTALVIRAARRGKHPS